MLSIVTHGWLILLILMTAGLALYVVSAVVEAWMDVRAEIKSRKREPMWWCPKHGHFRKENCIPLFPEMIGGEKINGAHVCPVCYKEMVFTNPNAKLKVS